MKTQNRRPLPLLLSAVERVCGYIRLDRRLTCRGAACIQGCGGVLFESAAQAVLSSDLVHGPKSDHGSAPRGGPYC